MEWLGAWACPSHRHGHFVILIQPFRLVKGHFGIITVQTLEFQLSEDEWQEETTQGHGEDKDKGQGQRGWSGLHHPQHSQADDLDAREEVHTPRLHPLDKGHIRVVLGWLEQEQDAVKELDATEGCDPHVQEDAKQYSQGDAGQDGFHENGQSHEHRDQEPTDPLFLDL